MPEQVKILPPSLKPWQGGDNKKTIAVMMSGGVDSSVTASILLEEGWDVLGITMKIPRLACKNEDPDHANEAVIVCDKLGISHYFIETEDVFKKYVVGYFTDSYLNGKTPNPCAECNKIMKFGILWDTVKNEMGIENFATGHYAKIIREERSAYLARGSDHKRDQSYFIYGIKREKLANFYLPLGNIEKNTVRKIAEEKNLHIANRPDSMDLCFAGEGDYRKVIGEKAKSETGNVYDLQGNILAQHNGIWNYTIGQRKGLGFAAGEPRYVLRINPQDNSITVGTRPEAYMGHIKIINPNILIPEKFCEGISLRVKIRSLSGLKECSVISIKSNYANVKFDEPQFAPTPGQHAVLYDDQDRVVAGGIIDSVF